MPAAAVTAIDPAPHPVRTAQRPGRPILRVGHRIGRVQRHQAPHPLKIRPALMSRGWRYAVEIRNRNWLHPEYFAMLRQHGVAHVYNHWTRMPPITEQLELLPARECPFIVGRWLLSPGRSLEWAREQFEPFHQLREIDPAAREAMTELIRGAIEEEPRRPAYLYVGNELEGNALHTIADILESVALA